LVVGSSNLSGRATQTKTVDAKASAVFVWARQMARRHAKFPRCRAPLLLKGAVIAELFSGTRCFGARVAM
jgi:hypothetical protein